MDLQEILNICRAYRDLGDAVAEQIEAIVDNRFDDANPNAVRMIHERFLEPVARVARDNHDSELLDCLAALDEDIDDYFESDADGEEEDR